MNAASLPRILVVTGTDTGVGKTVTTAALAGALASPAWGRRTVAVYKPAQTGVLPGESGDMDEVRRLAAPATAAEGIRLRDPMAPVAAAFREDVRLPGLEVHAERIRQLASAHDHVLVEGAGGLLVELDHAGRNLADLAAALGASGLGTNGPGASDEAPGVVLVTRSGLGTLNHTLLTLEALARRGLAVAGVVIGAWPEDPDEVAAGNAEYLRGLDVPLAGAIPAGASALEPHVFRDLAPHWLSGLSPAPLPLPLPFAQRHTSV